MASPPVVRFAPSPTGYLHIGGARTALYNWLYARGRGGRFVLRIEDSDQERSTPESEVAIFEGLRWLGLDWDEGPDVGGPHGPYRQSERLERYRQAADRLIAERKAYRCSCTAEDLARMRSASPDPRAFRYPGVCRDRAVPADVRHVVRFVMPATGTTGWDDLVKGRIEVANETLQDEVILRPNGLPLYNFGAVVDDVDMEIDHVIRGDDHVVNTPRQIQMFRALGRPEPRFAHLPMILGEDKKKLSKRTGTVSVLQYRDDGYLPHALVNFLARIGWSHGDQEIFTLGELVAKFDFDAVSASGGVWNAKKLDWLSSHWIRQTPVPGLADLVLPFLGSLGVADCPRERLEAAVALQRERAKTLKELASGIAFYFQRPLVLEAKAAEKTLDADALARVEALAQSLELVAPFDPGPIEAAVAEFLRSRGLELKAVAQAARVALTGRTQSPGLYDVMSVLGRDGTLARLRGARTAPRG
ncbi:MAG: glutamate--tRNA ligase [Deltaproteobacteria bacterium]|nr:glutamate--tRNA ligase [Deltaproteobacteria bacterium]